MISTRKLVLIFVPGVFLQQIILYQKYQILEGDIVHVNLHTENTTAIRKQIDRDGEQQKDPTPRDKSEESAAEEWSLLGEFDNATGTAHERENENIRKSVSIAAVTDTGIRKNTTHKLTNYEYSHCPFVMTKFSQHRMTKSGPFSSNQDYMIHSNHRAERALNISNDMLAYHRVKTALEDGAFDNRIIVLDGDSLQRQNYISLACLAWEAGFVQSYSHYVNVIPASKSTILRNTSYGDEPTSYFSNGYVLLQGGGEIHYTDNVSKMKKIGADLAGRRIGAITTQACDNHTAPDSDEIKAQLSVNVSTTIKQGGEIRMAKEDVLVIAGSHHASVRQIFLREYNRTLSCMKCAKESKKKTFERWPHIVFATSSVSSFWTESGQYSGRPLANSDPNSCRIKVPGSERVLRTEERNILGGKVPFIGGGLELQNLGDLHLWHGDCLHWIQPGIPDIYAADLADYLLATKRDEAEER